MGGRKERPQAGTVLTTRAKLEPETHCHEFAMRTARPSVATTHPQSASEPHKHLPWGRGGRGGFPGHRPRVSRDICDPGSTGPCLPSRCLYPSFPAPSPVSHEAQRQNEVSEDPTCKTTISPVPDGKGMTGEGGEQEEKSRTQSRGGGLVAGDQVRPRSCRSASRVTGYAACAGFLPNTRGQEDSQLSPLSPSGPQ